MSTPAEYKCASCGSVFRRAGSNLCFVCGTPGDPVIGKPSESNPHPAAAKRSETSTQAASPPAMGPVDVYFAGRRLIRAVKWFVAAAVCFVLGAWLIFDSELHDDPRKLGTGDVVRGVAPIVVGIVMLVMAWLVMRRPSEVKRAER